MRTYITLAYILFTGSIYAQNYVEATPDGNLKAKKFIFTTPKTSYYAIDESQFVGT